MNERTSDPPACYGQGQGQSKTEMPKPSHQHPSHLALLPKRKKGSRIAQGLPGEKVLWQMRTPLQHWRGWEGGRSGTNTWANG